MVAMASGDPSLNQTCMSLMVFLVREETGVAGGNPLGHRENTADKLHTERPTKNNKRCVHISKNASEGMERYV